MRRRGGTISTLWSRFINDRDVEYRVVANFSPGHPGKTYGPPEDCYPPEGPEIEYAEVFELGEKTKKRIDLGEFIDSLTKEQDAALQERLIQEAEDYGTDAEADAGDRAYDEWKDRQLNREEP